MYIRNNNHNARELSVFSVAIWKSKIGYTQAEQVPKRVS